MNTWLEPAFRILERLFSKSLRFAHLGLWVATLALASSGCASAGVRIVHVPEVTPLVTATPAYQLKVAVKNYSDKEASPAMQLRVTMQVNKTSDVGGRSDAPTPDCNGHHIYQIASLAPQQEWTQTALIQDISGCGGCAFHSALGLRCAGVVGLKLTAASTGGAKLEGSDFNVTWSINGDPARTQVTEVPR